MNLYQEHILDHYHHPRNWGVLAFPTHQSRVKNPTCGDSLRFDLSLKKGRVENMAWQGEGCALSLASASLLSESVVGNTKEELLLKTQDDILSLLKIPLSPGRLKCGILGLEALHLALQQPKK